MIGLDTDWLVIIGSVGSLLALLGGVRFIWWARAQVRAYRDRVNAKLQQLDNRVAEIEKDLGYKNGTK